MEYNLNMEYNLKRKLSQVQDLLLMEFKYALDDGAYASRSNISPNKWGKSAWDFLDSITKGYPSKPTTNEQVQMTAFLISLGEALPCRKCRSSYTLYMTKYPPATNAVSSKVKLRRWLTRYKNGIK